MKNWKGKPTAAEQLNARDGQQNSSSHATATATTTFAAATSTATNGLSKSTLSGQ